MMHVPPCFPSVDIRTSTTTGQLLLIATSSNCMIFPPSALFSCCSIRTGLVRIISHPGNDGRTRTKNGQDCTDGKYDIPTVATNASISAAIHLEEEKQTVGISLIFLFSTLLVLQGQVSAGDHFGAGFFFRGGFGWSQLAGVWAGVRAWAWAVDRTPLSLVQLGMFGSSAVACS
jgi:hypothetical protein